MTGEQMVIMRRLDTLGDELARLRAVTGPSERKVAAAEDAQRAYEQVRSSVERHFGIREREYDKLRRESQARSL